VLHISGALADKCAFALAFRGACGQEQTALK